MNYPVGLAFFQGDFTSYNASSVTPLRIYDPMTACPMILLNIGSYQFQPSSDVTNVLSNGSPTPVLTDFRIDPSAIASGYWPNNQEVDFAPGVYTVVAGDEWGALA